MVPRSAFLRWLKVALPLVVIGQFVLQALGRLAPAAVRATGAWSPVLAPDSLGYLAAAADLPEVQGRYLTKIAYVLLLRVDRALALDGWGVVLLQLVVLAVATAFVADHVARHHNDRAALLSAAVLALNLQVAQWVTFILTDSLFISLTVILSIVLARFLEQRTSLLAPLALGVGLVLLRPNGLGAAVGVAIILIAGMRRFRLAIAAVTLCCILAVVLLAPGDVRVDAINTR
jgi:hypothetical protein